MIVLAFSLPGFGKSTLLHDLVKAQAHAQRFFIVDHDWSWGPEGYHWRGAPPENLVVVSKKSGWPDMPDVGVLACRGFDPMEIYARAVAEGWSTVVDDEIDKTARKKGWDDSPLRGIVHEGRHLENASGEFTEMHLYGAARRVQNLHTDLTELASEIYVGRLKGKNTLQRLVDENAIEEDQTDEIRALPKFRFWWTRSDGEGRYLEINPL